MKNRQQAEVVIGGYSPGTGNRSNTFGSLLVGRWDGDRLAFAGGVGTGFTQRRLEELKARFDALRTADCPFDPAAADRLPPRRGVGPARARRPTSS